MGKAESDDKKVANDVTAMAVTTDVATGALSKFLQDSRPSTYNTTITQRPDGMVADTTSNNGTSNRMEIRTRSEDTGRSVGLFTDTQKVGLDIYKESPGKDANHPVRTMQRADASLSGSFWDQGFTGTDARMNFQFSGRNGESPIKFERANQIDWKPGGKVQYDANGFPKKDFENTTGANCFLSHPGVNADKSCAFRVDGLKKADGSPLYANASMEINPYANGFRERFVVRENASRNVIAIVESNVTNDASGRPKQIETTVRPPRKPQ